MLLVCLYCRGPGAGQQSVIEIETQYMGKETRLFAPFIYKMIVLPRQARDKHRENSIKDVFMQSSACRKPTWSRSWRDLAARYVPRETPLFC